MLSSMFATTSMPSSMPSSIPFRRLPMLLVDARPWQILSLGLLLAYGMLALAFDQAALGIPLILCAALATQWVCGWASGADRFDPLSPLITGLSLCLLLRTSHIGLLPLAAALGIASKYLIRINDKHVFNPANFAIVAMMLLTGEAWVSPAQWGSATWAAFLLVSLATLVLSRAKRADIALAFLATYVGLLLARAWWLGDPLAIPLKQMQSGALLLFAFFMISDPKTTPDCRSLRIVYGALVALLGFTLQFAWWKPDGLIWALFLASPLVPLLDALRPVERARRFQWSRPTVQ